MTIENDKAFGVMNRRLLSYRKSMDVKSFYLISNYFATIISVVRTRWRAKNESYKLL